MYRVGSGNKVLKFTLSGLKVGFIDVPSFPTRLLGVDSVEGIEHVKHSLFELNERDSPRGARMASPLQQQLPLVD